MATWYFDAVNGSDSNGGHSASDAKKNWNAFVLGTSAAGDWFLFRLGTTQVISTAFITFRTGTSATVRSRFATYGTSISGANYVLWTNPTAAGNMVINLANAQSYIDIEDMRFDAGTVCTNAIYAAIQGSSNAGNIRLYRCHFKNAVSSGFNTGTEGGKTGISSGFIFEDCEFYDNGGHGLILSGVNTSIMRRCKFYRNGATLSTGGHGFSSGAAKTTASSGWTTEATDATGKTWKRTLAANETAVYYVRSSTAYPRLRLTAGTQSAPAAGEFGFTGGILYVNMNSTSNPSGQSVIYAWKRAYALTIEDCEAYENVWNLAAPFHEGHGFAADDWADDSSFLRNKSYNNQGAGFSINRGDRNKLVGNIAYGNWQAGAIGSPCDSLILAHNTFYNNNAGTDATSAEIFSNGTSKDWVITNNILLSTVAYGVSRETTDTGFTGGPNAIYGYTVAAEKNPILTGNIHATPLLDSNYRPLETQLVRTGTYLGYKDFNGKQFYNPPNIGAVDDKTNTPRFTLRTS